MTAEYKHIPPQYLHRARHTPSLPTWVEVRFSDGTNRSFRFDHLLWMVFHHCSKLTLGDVRIARFDRHFIFTNSNACQCFWSIIIAEEVVTYVVDINKLPQPVATDIVKQLPCAVRRSKVVETDEFSYSDRREINYEHDKD